MSVPSAWSRSTLARPLAVALVVLALSVAACGRLTSQDAAAGGDETPGIDGGTAVPPVTGGGEPGSTGGGSDPGAPGDGSGGGAAFCPTEVPTDAGPDTVVCHEATPGGGGGGIPDPVPSPVEPRPGMANVYPIGWDDAHVGADGRTVTIDFVSGVEPCYVLDHVDVDFGADTITITLYQGNDPDAGDVACIEIAQYKSVTITLDHDVDGRTIVDGAGDPAA